MVYWVGATPYLVGTWYAWSKVGGGQQPCNRNDNQQYVTMTGYRGSASNSPVYNWVKANTK